MPTVYAAAARQAPTLVLAHGAGAGQDHPWMVRAAEGLAARGVRVVTFNFPYRDAGRRFPDPARVLEEAFEAVWKAAAPDGLGPMFAGGKSMGGRIASQVAARSGFQPTPAGLVFFGYPLHPPGKPAQRRDRHLPDVPVPMLFVSGTRDPFGRPDELAELSAGLPLASLRLIDGGDHSLSASKRQDPHGVLVDHALDLAAEWMRLRYHQRHVSDRPAPLPPTK